MSSTFYKSIIEDEITVFKIKKESLKVAADSVGKTYSFSALTEGNTFLDYNNPSNRCAYLYKFASIHTGLVTKYFKLFLEQKSVKSILNKKEKIKICCLGGGPGTDIVGLFKALSIHPHYQKKVVEVTVLDICGGWRNSFKRIISNLVAGKVKNVSENFVDAKNFKFKLIEVNLLNSLPANVVSILSEADVVCMVKFVSAILGSSTSVSALEVIGEKLKISAIVLFIDNFNGNVFKPLTDIARHIGLKTVIGPLHESFDKTKGFIKTPTSAAEKEMFGCSPCVKTRVTVLGFIKSNELLISELNKNINPLNEVMVNEYHNNNDDDDWDTDDESEVSSKQNLKSRNVTKGMYDKFTQTCDKYIKTKRNGVFNGISLQPDQSTVLESLVDSLSDLVNVLNEWRLELGRHSPIVIDSIEC